MKHLTKTFLFWLLIFTGFGASARSFAELEPARIAEVEKLLPQLPNGFGRPISDRAFWGDAKTRNVVGNPVASAEKLLGEKFPVWSDDLYLEFSRTGIRPPGEKMLRDRKAWLYPLVLAECLENQGRFLPLLNQILREYANEPSWTLPAHDGNLDNFKHHRYSVDLASSAFGADLAQTIYFLGDKIDPAVRQQLIAALEERIFTPIRQSLMTGKGSYWLGSKSASVQNNWNAVCLAGVVSAARTILSDRHDRAVFIAAGEHYSAYFINGFRADGYCDEGAGYWAYGFGNYVILREVLIDATGGQIDLFVQPKIREIALYGERIQLSDHLTPPFADCRFGVKADSGLVNYCKQVLKITDVNEGLIPAVCNEKLAAQFMPATPCFEVTNQFTTNNANGSLRSFFDQAGVLVCRPASNKTNRISVAIKAGGNSSHSHNDVGSFVIAVGGVILVGDPGGPFAYNNKVFGPERFTYKILNSYGHPVPVIAGELQRDATKIKPRVLATNFKDVEDEIEIDLKPAYTVPTLIELTRTLRYFRGGAGKVEIEDAINFSEPEIFEMALPTLGKAKQIDDYRIEFVYQGEKIIAHIETPDGFRVASERIEELGAPAFDRVGIILKKPVTKTTIKITFCEQN